MHDLRHMVEHIPVLQDLISFLANDGLVLYNLDVEFTRGTPLVRARVSPHLHNKDQRFA
jgi:hypothetical protein